MNNFDQSSTGVNLELDCSMDQDLARTWWEDNFTRMDTDGSSAFNDRYFNVDTFLFTGGDDVDPDDFNVSKKIAIRGYSQGDYAEIIIPTNLGFKRGFDFEEHCTNLFYNCPVYCRLEIDGEEYCLDEYLDNIYDYDKNLIVEKFKKDLQHDKKDLIIDWLADNLPDYPDYH